jgi:hypothetical protein
MREISLTQGKTALVDDEDYEYLMQWNWHVASNRYASRAIMLPDGKKTKISMHRIIMSCPEFYEIDHINRNTFDNRKSNLRIVSRKQNADNRKNLFKNNTSGAKGVCFHNGKWQASYRNNGLLTYIGRFNTIEEAKEAYETTKSHLTKE